MANMKELRAERLRKLDELRKAGIDPYPAEAHRTHVLGDVTQNFSQLEGQEVTVAGRLINTRKFGKIAFFVIKDSSGSLQLFLRDGLSADTASDKSGLGYAQLNLLDPGDFIEASGKVAKTQTGEISIEVDKLRLLTKALRPLPTPQEGFTDKEQRLRRRYIDLNINPEIFERFIRRSRFWQATREFLLKEGFLEMNIPVLEHTTGGADANPFVTHMDALDDDFYLRISHELPLKRLLGGGYDRVFDIGPRFRNENYSDEHLPEHIAFESYAAYQGYDTAMELYERMMKEVAHATWGKLSFTVGKFEVNLDQKWPVVKYADIMKEKFGIDVFVPDLAQLKKILHDHKVKLEGEINTNRALDSVWKLIRKDSSGPFWLIHEPVSISPLAKQHPSDPQVAQRFHPVIGGTEMGNGYAELNDPLDQLQRFVEQQSLRDAGDSEAQMLDIDFVEMLEYGMPTATGWSYSERYFWALEGVSAREGVIFPQLRRETDELTKSLYPEVFSKKAVATVGVPRLQDFSHKIVVVVSKELGPWQVANAVAHMSAIVGNKTKKEQLVTADDFITADGAALPRNPQYAIIIKRAEQKELHKLYTQVKEARLTHHVFIKEMQDNTDDKVITEHVRNKTVDTLTFYGICFMASNKQADDLTKSLQLYK